MSYNQLLMKKIGQIAANKPTQELELVIDEYYNTLSTAPLIS